MSALLSREARNHATAEEVKAETRRLRSVDVCSSVGGKDVAPATDAEMANLATALQRQLALIEPEASKRSWYKLFKHYDENGDGHITYDELMDLIRKRIKLSTQKIPDEQVQAVWHSIDANSNGVIDAGEFGRFFRMGDKPKERRRARAQTHHFLPAVREPTAAEVNIEASLLNRANLEREERLLQRQLRRSAVSMPTLPTVARSASQRSLPPLR